MGRKVTAQSRRRWLRTQLVSIPGTCVVPVQHPTQGLEPLADAPTHLDARMLSLVLPLPALLVHPSGAPLVQWLTGSHTPETRESGNWTQPSLLDIEAQGQVDSSDLSGSSDSFPPIQSSCAELILYYF